MSILAEDSGFIIPLKETYPITPEELAEAKKAFKEFDKRLRMSECFKECCEKLQSEK